MRRLPEAAPAENEDKYYQVDAANTATTAVNSEFRSAVESILAEQKAADEAAKVASEADGVEVGKDLGMSASWKNGVEIQSKDKAFRLHVGGRYQFDASAFSVDPAIQTVETPGVGAPFNRINTPYTDGVDFRRARFRMDGTMYENIDFAIEFDFINSNNYFTSLTPTAPGVFPQNPLPTAVTAPTDLWWTFTKLPVVGNIRVGNQKEAIGFEHLVSSRFLPFMERSYNQDTFYGGSFNGFSPGISMFNTMWDDRGTWNIGVFKPADQRLRLQQHQRRLRRHRPRHRLPCYGDEGPSRDAPGFSASHRTGYDDVYRYPHPRRHPQRHLVDLARPADTGNILMATQTWLNAEFAGVRGPWTWQGEYLSTSPKMSAPLSRRRASAGRRLGTASITAATSRCSTS